MVPPRVHQCPDVPLWLPTQRQERFDFRCDEQPPSTGHMRIRLHRPEKRLDSVPITDRDEELALLVIYYTGELAAKVISKVEAVVGVQGNNELGVGARSERVGWVDGFQVSPETIIVVEFAIHDGMYAMGTRVEGLDSGGRQVVDREANMAKP